MDLWPLSRKELAAALIELHDDANRSIGNKWWSVDALAAFLVRKHDLEEVNKRQIKLALNDIKAGLHGDIKLATEMKSMAYPDPDVATPAATGDNASVVAATEANSTESKEEEAVNNKEEEPTKEEEPAKEEERSHLYGRVGMPFSSSETGMLTCNRGANRIGEEDPSLEWCHGR